MKKHFIPFSLWLFSALGSLLISIQVQAGLQATVIDRQCTEVRQDPFDLGWRITETSQKFSGLCVNAKSVRPVKVLSKTLGQVTFANFYHQGKYWKARWTKTDIPRVSLVIVHFGGGGVLLKPAHTELLFQFPKGLTLHSQTSNEIQTVKDVVLSWEAVFTEGGRYDFKVGLRDNFPIAGRITSLAARIPENLPPNEDYRRMERYSLSMTSTEAQFLFLQSIVQSDAWKYDHFYNTLSPNCTTKPFDIIDTILERTRPGVYFPAFFTEWSLDPIAGPSRQALLARRLISGDQKPTSLNQELKLPAR